MSSDVQSLRDEAEPAEPEAGVRASVSVPAPLSQVWQHLISPSGAEALLGEGARIGNKGEPWHSAAGSHGVIRSFHPREQVRVTWHPGADGPLSMLDVKLHEAGDGTRLDLFHEGRGIAGDPRWDLQHWEAALARIASGIQA